MFGDHDSDCIGFFDMETTGLSEDAEPCVAVVTVDGIQPRIFHGGVTMNGDSLKQLCDTLNGLDKVVTFNGAAYDFKILCRALESQGMNEEAVEMAELGMGPRHCDIMLDFAANSGYYGSMDSFAKATLDGVSKSGTGKWAAETWAADPGNAEVISYCVQDTTVLADLYYHGLKWGSLDRVTA